jgi:hypothetical protein
MRRPRTSRRAAALVVAVVTLGCAAAPAAWADGDPASDVLAAQDVFYPYQPRVSPLVRQQLDALVKRVRADGLRVKVAVISSPNDLGTQTKRFDKPRSYAELLGVELEITSVHDFVLVAMPAGLATYRYNERGLPVLRRAIAPVAGPGVADADAIARSAARGVIAMAAATGQRPPAALAAPFALARPGASAGSSHTLLAALAGLGWLAAIAAAFALRVSRAKELVSDPAGTGSGRAGSPPARLPA